VSRKVGLQGDRTGDNLFDDLLNTEVKKVGFKSDIPEKIGHASSADLSSKVPLLTCCTWLSGKNGNGQWDNYLFSGDLWLSPSFTRP